MAKKSYYITFWYKNRLCSEYIKADNEADAIKMIRWDYPTASITSINEK